MRKIRESVASNRLVAMRPRFDRFTPRMRTFAYEQAQVRVVESASIPVYMLSHYKDDLSSKIFNYNKNVGFRVFSKVKLRLID